MKTISFCFGLLLAATDSLGQGTFDFSAYLAKRPSAPFEMTGSETTVIFTLSGTTLSGRGTFQTDMGPADPFVRSADGAIISTAGFVPVDPGEVGRPFVMVDAIWDPVALDQQRVDQLMRSEFSVSIWARPGAGTDGYVEGPLLLVPEPGVAA